MEISSDLYLWSSRTDNNVEVALESKPSFPFGGLVFSSNLWCGGNYDRQWQ
ncbi:hypothetical protein MiAbW_01448 [Microcystis aeruginosa NIES-4325]|uniref:Uncharacterized protein n=1 Tax=Microcystis aeruginosa NIES-4325 TaxID=2569534 RepID=A0A5J4F8J7_MICAE|nr:hypothetical protein MiAbW_01448 [Microcystis aeruginosa NIES-4325]